jgi:predicted  nucleic acid-binding Zn-ribbon protein
MTTKVNEARDLVRKLKKEHRELNPRIQAAEEAVGATETEEAKKAAQAEYDLLKLKNADLEAKRATARKNLDASRDELRKELNRRISSAKDFNELALLRITARRESLPENRIKVKYRALGRRRA